MMATITQRPREAGFRMPGEFSAHAGCLMAWPTRAELWGTKLNEAKADYAAVARAVARFEPVLMVCLPGSADEVRSFCGANVTPIELPINDSWTRTTDPSSSSINLANRRSSVSSSMRGGTAGIRMTMTHGCRSA